jgi:hypothetical protein
MVLYVHQLRSLPFEIAGQITGLHPRLLQKLVREGVLRGEAPFRVRGAVGSCDGEQAREIADQLKARRRDVDGRGIKASTAAEKYGFNRDTIYSWRNKGWIRQIGVDPAGEFLVDEGDIAFARAIADLVGQKQGKPVFPKGNGPYQNRND